MKILDRYILKTFLKTYVFVVIIIVLIICVIDYTEKVDNFLSNHVSKREIFWDYYINLAPYWANTVSPLMIFIATVFFTSRMAARTEIVAILSTGVSFNRLMRPYLLGSLLVAVLTFFLVAYILPLANKTRIAFEQKYVKGTYYFDGRNVHIKVAPDVYAYMESYNSPTNTGYKFTLERIEGTELKQKLTADRIMWDSTKAKWTVYDFKIRTLGQRETFTFGTSKDTLINLSPKDFASNYMLYETFTLDELNRHIRLLRSRGSDGIEVYLIERAQRFVTPLAVIILTLMGLIFSARKSRGGVGFQVALGFMLAFIYIMFFLMSRGLAEGGSLPILLAVSLPSITFGFITFILYFTVPR